MSELLLLLLIVISSLYWLSAMRCKDIAIAAARRECKICDVQFLDQTVQLVKLSMSRDQTGHWRFWREYRFEYTGDGDTRNAGKLSMLGPRVVHIALETFNPVIH